MTVFSAFRLPVKEEALNEVLSPLTPLWKGGTGDKGIASGGESAFSQELQSITPPRNDNFSLGEGGLRGILARLIEYRMLRYDARHQHYTTHPLIRNHYLEGLQERHREDVQGIHKRIKSWYLASAGKMSEVPTIDELAPLIQAVHHACQGGEYDEAFDIVWEQIYQHDSYVITGGLGAYDTYLALLLEFFPQGDTSQEPQVSKPADKSFILNAIALCLMNLGRLREASPFYERATKSDLAQSDWSNASARYRNLAQLYAYLGDFLASAKAASEAIILSDRKENQDGKRRSLVRLAYTIFLQGDKTKAGEAFQQAEVLQQAINPSEQYLYTIGGIWHAEYLLRSGDREYAVRVTEANLKRCQEYHLLDDTSRSHRVLGDLRINPQFHYDEALKIARSISHRAVLIEALLGRGRWLVGLDFISKQMPPPQEGETIVIISLGSEIRSQNELTEARQNLEKALHYATIGGYRRYEADIRITLAWLLLVEGNPTTAAREAERAKTLSIEMGYYWGQMDAQEVLSLN